MNVLVVFRRHFVPAEQSVSGKQRGQFLDFINSVMNANIDFPSVFFFPLFLSTSEPNKGMGNRVVKLSSPLVQLCFSGGPRGY